jgi:TRAP transporter 4TM/12TM fusion protein
MQEAAQESGRFRSLTGAADVFAKSGMMLLSIVTALYAFDFQSRLGIVFFFEQYLGLVLGVGLATTFLAVRTGFTLDAARVPLYDWLLALLGLGVGLFVTIRYPSMAYSLSALSPDRWIVGGLAIILILEATRRLLGMMLVIIAVVFLAYVKWAYLFPGVLFGKGASAERIASYVYFDANGVFGIALAVGAAIVAVFVLFGHLLHAVGGGAFFTDIALSMLGRFKGGPAKVAVVSSALFGTMSGSVVSNVVVSGSVSIPLMKNGGYRPEFAAATEATASTGGQIMPPVMGVAAFIIAENLSIPYKEVAIAAIVPAVLYYLSLFVQIDLEARKSGLAALSASEIPRIVKVFREGGLYLLPLACLIYTLLFANWSAGSAGLAAVGATLLVAMIKRPAGFGLGMIRDALIGTGRTLLDIIIVSALAGVVIGAVQLSGLGFTLSLVLTSLAAGSKILLLLVTAGACIVLGMGMPTTVVYVMLAVMVAPALVQVGVPPLAAHLFVFYFGMLSMITPPVCMATIAGAAMAQAPFWRTAVIGMRLGAVAYIVPFFMVFHPALLLGGELSWLTVIDIGAACIGVCFMAFGSAGYLFRSLGMPLRVILFLCGMALMSSNTTTLLQALDVVGLVLGLGIVAVLWWSSREQIAMAAEKTL